MKNASELKSIAIAECERRTAERAEKARKYLETYIVPQMEKAAAEGRLYTEYHTDAWVDLDVIFEELSVNGYTHSKSGRTIKIYWT